MQRQVAVPVGAGGGLSLKQLQMEATKVICSNLPLDVEEPAVRVSGIDLLEWRWFEMICSPRINLIQGS